MDAVGCEEEAGKEDLESAEGYVGCYEEGWGGTGGEDGLPEVGEEVCHVVSYALAVVWACSVCFASDAVSWLRDVYSHEG